MPKQIDLILSPKDASDEKFYLPHIASFLNVKQSEIFSARIIKRSIDARKRDVKINLRFDVVLNEADILKKNIEFNYPDVSQKSEVLVIGAGPAGLFAALRLIESGYKPIVLERGKKVENRKADIAAIHKSHFVNTDSNYCFGEGGAGTFSDGKLYTRSNKRGNISKILEVLHFHGADEDILIDAHPHIGTNKLPGIITKIRESIENAGGKIIFDCRIIDFIITDNIIKGVETQKGDKIFAKAVILATGHSARDIYELLHHKNILIEAKPTAMGIRVEHPQELIDKIQYHGNSRGEYLPVATYGLAEQVNGRGVFSFCMCPGGIIVPASTANGEVVVNGMSSSARNSPYANSGIVVEIKTEDYKKYEKQGALAGLRFQQDLEKKAFLNGGEGLKAPAQRVSDFVSNKLSESLPKTSYHPGVNSSKLNDWLPEIIGRTLQEGFKSFDKKMRGFLTNEAIMLGVESRTSTPVKIPRDRETFEHVQIKGLFPCGEGAGYAGGIVSSAVDGENCAEKLVDCLKSKQ